MNTVREVPLQRRLPHEDLMEDIYNTARYQEAFKKGEHKEREYNPVRGVNPMVEHRMHGNLYGKVSKRR